MAKPLRLPGVEEQRVLDELEIQLLVKPAQQARWNRLVKERHYLRNANLVGEQCRYAVSYQGQWVALLGWSAAAWHLGPRDEWLGWSEDQRRRRLHFLAQNSRFVILADRTRYPNLGTRSMKLCLDRLSADWQAQHGHPLVAPESFVDGQLFRGTLYKAANWTMLGPTAGFGRVAEDFYVLHARPKQLWVRLLQPQARAWLCAPQLPAPLQAYEKPSQPAVIWLRDNWLRCENVWLKSASFAKARASVTGWRPCWPLPPVRKWPGSWGAIAASPAMPII
jgi:hypothetical protein